MFEGDPAFQKVVEYMKSHWPSAVKPEWQVALKEYPAILERVLSDFTPGCSTKQHLVRIAGLSGSGKTTQLLPAAEAYFAKQNLAPVLVAARRFAPYHPHYQEISDFYGEAKVRSLTDEFSTIMMFLTLAELTKHGYDIILDVTLLDPVVEQILVGLLKKGHYQHLLVMIAASPEVTEKHLGGRSWRHTRETELEFIRATSKALEFYAAATPDARIVIWNTYEKSPVYDGRIADSLTTFERFSAVTDVPAHDEDALRAAKLAYLTKM